MAVNKLSRKRKSEDPLLSHQDFQQCPVSGPYYAPMTPLEYDFEDIPCWSFQDFPQLQSELATGTCKDIIDDIIVGLPAKDISFKVCLILLYPPPHYHFLSQGCSCWHTRGVSELSSSAGTLYICSAAQTSSSIFHLSCFSTCIFCPNWGSSTCHVCVWKAEGR